MLDTYLKKPPVCPYCKKDMVLDDIDYNFKGCQDEYWRCSSQELYVEPPHYIAFVKVRYNKVIKISYEEAK